MARMVRREATGPIRIDPPPPPPPPAPGEAAQPPKPIWICACGLSQTFPFCDKSHKACRDTEPEPGMLYMYGKDNKTIVEVRPDEP